MNQLQQARKAAGIPAVDIIKEIQTVEPRMDKSLFSKIETGAVLPTVPEFKIMCREYGKEPADLLSPADVDFGLNEKKAPKKAASPEGGALTPYKLTFVAPEVVATELQLKIKACGYRNITDWGQKCLKRLDAEYKRKQRAKEKPPCGNRAAAVKTA